MATYDDDDIVISGIGGHFPSSDSPIELMENLFNGVDMTTHDHTKWPLGERGVPHKLGTMKDLTRCDAQFFGIIRKQCDSMDPVTRQFLERTLEAIFDAGLSPLDLKGTKTGVFMSCALLETEMVLMHCSEQESYGIMGRTRALNANRLSYWLDLKGPSFATDCFYNGGIQAINEAYQNIKAGIIDAAIVGSGGTIIHSNASYQYQKLNLLCPDGNTRSFDVDADGYARSEAAVVLMVQRARDAKRCHATILNVLNRSMCGNDNLFCETGQAQWKDVLEKFYSECKVDPRDVVYLEADGAAIPAMDAAELNATEEILCKNRTADNPLLVGSVKSNLGHAEGAANLCGVAKLLIALEYDRIPKNLFYTKPNPNIKGLIKGTMKVVTEETPLNGDLVALSSYGLNTSYGHLVLRKNQRKKKVVEYKEGSLPQIFLVSSRNEDGINEVLDKIEAEKFDPEYANLVNNAFRRNLPGHMFRGFTVLPMQEPHVRGSSHFSGDERPVWFIFSGMGSQWPTMARDWMGLPVFRKSIEISAKILNNHGIDLLHILTHDDVALFDSILHCFVCIVSVQIALVDVLKAIGIEPDGIIGHSVGETSASYADGCLTHEQTLLSAYYRGRASVETKVIKGMMAAVGVGYQQMKEKLPEGIVIACHNGPDSCTLSGPVDQVNDYVKQLQSEGIFARAVNVANIPYHSKYIEEMGPIMHSYLKQVIPVGRERSARWVSTSIPESQWGEPFAKMCSADYHINNLLSPVLFEEGSRFIPKNAITIEIAPHGLLQAILKRSIPTCTNIALTNRNVKNQQHCLLKAIGTMYLNGLQPKVENLYPEITYPVSKGTSFISPLVTWDHSDLWSNYKTTVLSKNNRSSAISLRLDQENNILRAYKQDGVSVVPQIVYLTEIGKVYASSVGVNFEESKMEFLDVEFFNPDFPISNEKTLSLFLSIQPGKGHFQVLRVIGDNEELVASGTVQLIEKFQAFKETVIEGQNEMTKEDFYTELLHSGHYYNDKLQVVSKLTTGNQAWRAQINWDGDLVILLGAMLQVRTLKASDQTNKLERIRKIRHLCIDTSDLSNGEVNVDLFLAPDVIRCGKVEIRDVLFESVPRNPIKFVKEELNNFEIKLPTPAETLQVDYLQFNGENMDGLQVAYAGHDNNKKKLMGIGLVDDVSASLIDDPILKWQIPAAWTAEDAISVPLNYGMAYYAVHTLLDITPDTAVVVTDATNKLGLACLRVLLQKTLNVVTVVNNDEEKLKVKTQLPKLPVENIFVNSKQTGQHVAMKIKAMCPKGLDIVINTGAPDIIEPSLKCLRAFSAIIELNDDKLKGLEKLKNTTGFLISASLYSCSGAIFQSASETVKKQIHQLLLNGLATGLVTPFKDPLIKNWRQTKTIKIDADRLQANARYHCNPDKAYLILGGDRFSCLNIAEWFVNRKAKNIMIVHQDSAHNNANLDKKLKCLEEKCKITIKTAETWSPELIDHIFTVSRGNIELTMLIPNGSKDDYEESVVQALCQKDTFLVTVARSESNAIKYCQERNTTNPTLTVVWDEPMSGRSKGFLQVFDRLLTSKISEVLQVDEVREVQWSENDFYDSVLPSSVEDVLENCAPPTELQIREIPTSSIGYQISKEVTPFFVFPGLTGRSALINRFRESLYPVFIVDLPSINSASMSEYAACAVPKIKALIKDKKGPFTLLGENWGGAVALEVGKMLEKTGEKIQVLLIGGSPAEIVSRKWTSLHDLDNIILNRVFAENPLIKKDMSWNEKLSVHLACFSPKNEKILNQALSTVRERANVVFTLEKSEPINGIVTCVSRLNIPRGAIKWMSVQEVQLIVVPKFEPLINNEIFENIHNNVPIKLA